MIDVGSGLPKAITPTDGQNLGMVRGLYVGVSGDLTVTPYGGGAVVLFKACPVGFAPILCQGVQATGTAATNIVALF